METLIVSRVKKSPYNITTTLKDTNGKVKAIFNTMLNQPKKHTKTIVVRGIKYKLNWDNVK